MNPLTVTVVTNHPEEIAAALGITKLQPGQDIHIAELGNVKIESLHTKKGMTLDENVITFLVNTASNIVGGALGGLIASFVYDKLSQKGKNAITINEQEDMVRKMEIEAAVHVWIHSSDENQEPEQKSDTSKTS